MLWDFNNLIVGCWLGIYVDFIVFLCNVDENLGLIMDCV